MNKNTLKEIIFYIGLHISVPLGLLTAFLYVELKKSLNGLLGSSNFIKLDGDDYKVMTFLFFVVVVLVFVANLQRKFIGKEEHFVFPFNRNFVLEKSRDKKQAIYHPIGREFLNKLPNGFTIGEFRNKYVRLPFKNSPEHQLLLGSPGSNKSTSILNALIYNFNYANPDEKLCSVLAVDCKPELSKKSIDECRNDIHIINPTEYDTWGFDAWFGLDQSSTDDEIKERAEAISRSLIPDLSSDNAHFSGNAQKLLSGFLMYGFRKGMSLTKSIVNILHMNLQDYISEIICDPAMTEHPKIIGKIKAFEGNTSDEFASITDTLEKDLGIFDTDTVQHCFDENPHKVTPYDLENGISVFLAIPDHLLVQYSKVFGMIIELCIKHLTSIKEENLEYRRPIWTLIDEGGSIYVPSLLDLAARGRSKRIQLSLVAQSYSQLEQLYGGVQARAILDCCKTTIVFSCNDSRTAKDLSSWTGFYRETKNSTHSSHGLLSVPDSTNRSEEYRPVLDISDIKELEKNNEVLVFANGDWFITKKAPYYTIDGIRETSDAIYKRNVGHIPQKEIDTSYPTFEDLL